jgi:hypothetical protein
MDRYTWWVRHGENVEIIDNIKNIVRDLSGGDYTNDLNLFNDEKMY